MPIFIKTMYYKLKGYFYPLFIDLQKNKLFKLFVIVSLPTVILACLSPFGSLPIFYLSEDTLAYTDLGSFLFIINRLLPIDYVLYLYSFKRVVHLLVPSSFLKSLEDKLKDICLLRLRIEMTIIRECLPKRSLGWAIRDIYICMQLFLFFILRSFTKVIPFLQLYTTLYIFRLFFIILKFKFFYVTLCFIILYWIITTVTEKHRPSFSLVLVLSNRLY